MLITESLADACAKLTYDIDLGPKPLDRERMKQQARAGENWHMSVLKLVFSYVNEGLSDSEIHEQTEPLTLTGYTPTNSGRCPENDQKCQKKIIR